MVSRAQNTLKPLDIVVLAELKLRTPEETRTQAALATKLGLSQPSVHRSLVQLARSGLWKGLQVQRPAFRDLIVHGIRCVYPAELGAPTRGLVTAHAGAGLSDLLASPQVFVWPLEDADGFGPALGPRHPTVPGAALRDAAFHELMALIDVFRGGRARERRLAESRLAGLPGAKG